LLRSRKNFDRRLGSCEKVEKILIGNSDLGKIEIGTSALVKK